MKREHRDVRGSVDHRNVGDAVHYPPGRLLGDPDDAVVEFLLVRAQGRIDVELIMVSVLSTTTPGTVPSSLIWQVPIGWARAVAGQPLTSWLG